MRINQKNIIIFLLILAAQFSYGVDMAYLKIGINESFMVNSYEGQSQKSLGFANGIVTDIGYKHDLDEKSDLLFIYELNYDGPGLKGASKESFNARGLDHFLMFKYTEKLSGNTSYYLKADFFYEFYRIAKSESWSNGLYNFGKSGIGSGFDFNTSTNNHLAIGLDLHYVWFPNYTDLSREAIYLLGTSGSQLSADSVNQNFIQIQFRIEDFLKLTNEISFHGGLIMFYRYYPKLTIDEDLTTPSSVKQKDFTLDGRLDFTFNLSKDASLEIRYNAVYYKSNYNYLYFKDISTFEYYKNFSSYHEHRLNVPLNYIVSERTILSFIPGFEYKKYIDRPAKDQYSSFTGQPKQYTYALSAGLALSYRKHENLTITPQYQFKYSKSNNLDAYAGYNFIAHYLGIQFTFEY